MTDRSTFERAIMDARAMLATMVASDLARLHLSSAGTEIFICRHPEPSPLLVVDDAPVAAPDAPVEHRVCAPHVATLVAAAAMGDRVVAGQPIATIAVLDSEEALLSPASGVVAALAAVAGDLVEYGQTLLVIEAVA